MADEREYSSKVVDGIEQAPSRAMLYPVGFTEEDFKKPQIGILAWLWISIMNPHRLTYGGLVYSMQILDAPSGGIQIEFPNPVFEDPAIGTDEKTGRGDPDVAECLGHGEVCVGD